MAKRFLLSGILFSLVPYLYGCGGCSSTQLASQTCSSGQSSPKEQRDPLVRWGVDPLILAVLNEGPTNWPPTLNNGPINHEPQSSLGTENGQVSGTPFDPVAPRVPIFYVFNTPYRSRLCPFVAAGGESNGDSKASKYGLLPLILSVTAILIAIFSAVMGFNRFLLTLIQALVGREERKIQDVKHQDWGDGLVIHEERVAGWPPDKVGKESAEIPEELTSKLTDMNEQYDDLAKKCWELESKLTEMGSKLEQTLNTKAQLAIWIEGSPLDRKFLNVEDSNKSIVSFWK